MEIRSRLELVKHLERLHKEFFCLWLATSILFRSIEFRLAFQVKGPRVGRIQRFRFGNIYSGFLAVLHKATLWINHQVRRSDHTLDYARFRILSTIKIFSLLD